jgi:Domain of unknown function (DUF4387)
MRELWQFTKLIRSKNAGPFELTFDIMFKDRAGYDLILKTGALSTESIAKIYRVELEEVRLYKIFHTAYSIFRRCRRHGCLWRSIPWPTGAPAYRRKVISFLILNIN